MKKLALGLVVWCLSWHNCFAENIVLEGISAIGDKRTAHFSIDGVKVPLKEGENVGEWIIAKINKRSVMLRDPANSAGKDAPLTEMSIHTPVPLVSATPNKANDKPTPPPGPTLIPDDQIPPGQRRVRTPFGDILVPIKDESKPAAAQQQTTPVNPFMAR